MSSILLYFITFITIVYAAEIHTPWIISAGPTYNAYKFNVLQHLTAISPYFESNSDGLSPDPPQGCIVDKVIYQVRHGSIYANEYDYVQTITPFLQRIKRSLNHVNFSTSVDLAFLSRWSSPISNSEEQIAQVSKLGFVESFNFGARLAYRYPDLLPIKKGTSFKLWASDSNRTGLSAEALFAGLHSGHQTIGHVVRVSEDKDQGADTLTPTKSCPKFDVSNGVKQADIWLRHYSKPIIARFNAQVSGLDLSSHDILAMQELCGYETIIRGYSPFCRIFTSDEWLSFEYYFDIKYNYELGYANELSPSIGMPWVMATSDLLSKTKTKDQHLYISVSHRQLPPLILTALGLYNDSEYFSTQSTNPTMPLDHINYQRTWKSSGFITFLSHIALERLHCQSVAYNGSFVRVLVNAMPKPLPGCVSGPGASCPLKDYKNYVKRRNDLFEDFSKVCGLKDKNVRNSLKFFSKDDDDDR